ncbi:MAG TPA: acyl-CoA dehydrogenase family protein, partial [Dehalococcoidia bacterium]
MDFERTVVTYSPELEAFRAEVRAWVDANVPDDLKAPIDEELGGLYPEEDHPVERAFGMDFRRKLGAKRWLYPAFPEAYGGGGLTRGHTTIIREELARKNPPLMWAVATDLLLGGLMVWASEEQKASLLPRMLSGEINCIETFTEPHGGSDLANVKSRAVRDGEDWILNGQKTFVTAPPNIGDLLYGPFMTDPDSPRHRNLGFFLIWRDTPGVTIIPLRLLNGINQNFVIYDNV